MVRKKSNVSQGSNKKQVIDYNDMPNSHKRQWYIDDDIEGSEKKYRELIHWLRFMASAAGDVFQDIGSLCYFGVGFPFLEVTVVTPREMSAKFVINKSNMYLVGVEVLDCRFQSSGSMEDFLIKSFDEVTHTGRYSSNKDGSMPWDKIGPHVMIEAINELHEIIKKQSSTKVSRRLFQVCEVFFVHLCEAARFNIIAEFICRTLQPIDGGVEYAIPTYGSEEDKYVTHKIDEIVDQKKDIYLEFKGKGRIDHHHSSITPPFFEKCIHSWGTLSDAWYAYASSGVCDMDSELASKLGIRSVKSLRCILGLLYNKEVEISKEAKR